MTNKIKTKVAAAMLLLLLISCESNVCTHKGDEDDRNNEETG